MLPVEFVELLVYIVGVLSGACGDVACSRESQVDLLQDLPAVVTYYNPSEGGINCDADCSHVADGTEVTDDLYGASMACDESLLGRTVTLPGIGTFPCKDTGGLVGPGWSHYYGRLVLYFDVMLKEEPSWNFVLLEDWELK